MQRFTLAPWHNVVLVLVGILLIVLSFNATSHKLPSQEVITTSAQKAAKEVRETSHRHRNNLHRYLVTREGTEKKQSPSPLDMTLFLLITSSILGGSYAALSSLPKDSPLNGFRIPVFGEPLHALLLRSALLVVWIETALLLGHPFWAFTYIWIGGAYIWATVELYQAWKKKGLEVVDDPDPEYESALLTALHKKEDPPKSKSRPVIWAYLVHAGVALGIAWGATFTFASLGWIPESTWLPMAAVTVLTVAFFTWKNHDVADKVKESEEDSEEEKERKKKAAERRSTVRKYAGKGAMWLAIIAMTAIILALPHVWKP